MTSTPETPEIKSESNPNDPHQPQTSLDRYLGNSFDKAIDHLESSGEIESTMALMDECNLVMYTADIFLDDKERTLEAANTGFKVGLALAWQLNPNVEIDHIELAAKDFHTDLQQLRSEQILSNGTSDSLKSWAERARTGADGLRDFNDALVFALAEYGFSSLSEDRHYFVHWARLGASVYLSAMKYYIEEMEVTAFLDRDIFGQEDQE